MNLRQIDLVSQPVHAGAFAVLLELMAAMALPLRHLDSRPARSV
jgi:hypothetical protein